MVACIVGAVYFWRSKNDHSIARRFLTSAYGPVIALIHFGVLSFWPESYSYFQLGFQISSKTTYLLIQFIPLPFLIYSLRAYQGNARLHLLLLPLALLAWIFNYLIGYFIIFGK